MDIFWMGSRHGLNDFEQIAILCVLVAAFISLIYAAWLRSMVLKKDKGTAKMQEIWNAIRIGADAYLGRQLKTILPLIGVLTVVMFFSVYVVPPSAEAQVGVCSPWASRASSWSSPSGARLPSSWARPSR